MKVRPKIYSDFKLVERDKPFQRTSNSSLFSLRRNPPKMFKNKRNFSIFLSPSAKSSLNATSVQPSPSKRMRLGNSFRNSTLIAENLTPSNGVLAESSPVLQRQPEVPAFLGEKISKIFIGQNDQIAIVQNAFYDNATRTLSRTVTPTTTVEQVEEQTGDPETNELLKSKYTPPPTPTDRHESVIEALTRQKADLEMEIKKIDTENEAIFESISQNKENCSKLQRVSLAMEDRIDIALKSFCQVRNLLNEIYNPGLEVTKNCSLILEETKRRHSTKLEKLLLVLNDRIETSEKATTSKEKELEHTIELHQRTLIALENQEREEREKRAELANKAKEVAEPPVQHIDEPELDPIQHSPVRKSPLKAAVNKPTPVADKSEVTEDDCVIIDCDYTKPGESNNEVNAMGATPEIQDSIEVISNQEWVANQSENNGTCEDEEETDIEESKEDEDEGSFTPQQAQRV